MNKSLSSTALTWYKYNGQKFVVLNNTRREQVTDGTVIGIRPIARSEDYYLALRSEPEKLYRINGKRARVIAQKSKAVRVVIGKPELTKEAKDVVDAATGSRLNADRFKPLVPPRNELKTEGVKTSNYQWRVVKDTTMEVDTNKTGRTILLKRGDIFGLRFVLPTQGGKFVMLDGTYESIPTSQYDSLVQQTPMLPLPRWPDTVLSPELIQEYRDRMQKKRIAARHEREREERAQDAAINNARKEADRKAKGQERVVRVNDGKENTAIAKMVTDAAREEAAKLQEKIEERKRNAGLKDEDLRRMKEAAGKKPFSKALQEQDAEDDDLGDDLEDNIETRDSGIVQPSGLGTEQKKLEVRAQQLSDLYSSVQKTYRTKIKDPDALSAKLTDIRAQYVEDVPKMRAGDEGIIDAWEQLLSDAESYKEKAAEPEEKKNVKSKKPEPADAEEDEVPDDAEEEVDESDEDSTEEDDAEEDSADEEVPDDAGEEADDSEEEADDFEEEDDAETDGSSEDADEEEVDDDTDSDSEEVDDEDGVDEEAVDGEEVEEDFDPSEMAAQEDSDGISHELAGGDVDEEVDDLSDVDEEEDTPPAPVKKDKSTKPSKKSEPNPEPEAEEDDEEVDSEEPESDESIDDVDEDTEADDAADDDLPQAAGVRDGNVDSDEGDILVFHDDTKQKRKYAIIQITPNAKDDRILEYTLWDTDGKPDSYKVVRINTGRKQHITDMADKVGQLPPKQFNQIAEQVADYQYDRSPIRS